MTVKELIKELQKMPQNATVYYQDFDAAEFENYLRLKSKYDGENIK